MAGGGCTPGGWGVKKFSAAFAGRKFAPGVPAPWEGGGPKKFSPGGRKFCPRGGGGCDVVRGGGVRQNFGRQGGCPPPQCVAPHGKSKIFFLIFGPNGS